MMTTWTAERSGPNVSSSLRRSPGSRSFRSLAGLNATASANRPCAAATGSGRQSTRKSGGSGASPAAGSQAWAAQIAGITTLGDSPWILWPTERVSSGMKPVPYCCSRCVRLAAAFMAASVAEC